MISFTRRRFLQSAGASVASLAYSGHGVARAAEGNPSFLVIGDWGKPERGKEARSVAAQLGNAAEALRARFVISTGDNFYPQGVTGVDDPKWRTAYEDVYQNPSLMCPWYPVLGNHDHDGNEQAQIDYSAKSDRWRMPSRYYSWTEILADGGTADFFFLDTEPIADLSWTDRWLWLNADVQRQVDWLEDGLAKSKAAWKIVVGHHPIYSGGQHGNTPELIEVIKPLLDRYGVRVYFNGHDHDLQHIVESGVHYLTSGSGSDVRPTAEVAGTRFAEARLGFTAAELSPTTMVVSFIDAMGAPIYSANIQVNV